MKPVQQPARGSSDHEPDAASVVPAADPGGAPPPPRVNNMLTEAEIAALRQDAKEATALGRKLLRERPDLRLKQVSDGGSG